MTKLIVFDKDGVILDLEATWLPVARAVAYYTASRIPDDSGRQIGGRELLAAIGVDEDLGVIDSRGIFAAGSFADIRECWQALLPANMMRLDEDEGYANDVRVLVDRHGRNNTVPKGDVETPLRELYERGYALALLTNDSEASARQSLGDLNLHDLFCAVVGADSGYGAKPGAEGFLHCCQQAGVTPAESMMVGDTMADHGAAQAACAGSFVAVANTYDERPHPDIEATNVIPTLGHLPQLMARRAALVRLSLTASS